MLPLNRIAMAEAIVLAVVSIWQLRTALLGKFDGNCGQSSEIIDAAEKITHPGYGINSPDQDFAVVKLSRKKSTTPVATMTVDYEKLQHEIREVLLV